MQVVELEYPKLLLGEGPIWDEPTQRFYFVDAARFELHAYDPVSGESSVLSFGSRIGSIALRESGGFIVALAEGLFACDEDGGNLTLLVDPEAGNEPRSDYNDGKVDHRGRFLLGGANLPREGEAPRANLYSIEPDGSVQILEREITISNGPCWSLDGKTLYHADSLRHEVYAYDYDLDSGAVSNKRVFATTHDLGGIPDGATVDAEGCLWVAICEGGRVVRFSPEGELLRTVHIPTPLTTSVCFGGADLDQLLVTSIDPTWAGKPAHPSGGALFLVTDLGVRGLPSRRFGA